MMPLNLVKTGPLKYLVVLFPRCTRWTKNKTNNTVMDLVGVLLKQTVEHSYLMVD